MTGCIAWASTARISASRSLLLPTLMQRSVTWFMNTLMKSIPEPPAASAPTRQISPPYAAALIDCASVPGPPTSTTRSTPRPLVRPRTGSAHSGFATQSTTSSAPTSFKRAPSAALRTVVITRAPRSLASWSANTATPPGPCVSTVSPARTPASADHAVTATQGSVAASSKVRCRGASESASAPTTLYSASQPSWSEPYVSRLGARGPPYQLRKKALTTRSPTLTRVTPEPTAATAPAASDIGITPFFTGNGDWPLMVKISRTLSAVAFTRTRTSPGPGAGVVSSCGGRASTLPTGSILSVSV